MNEPNKICKKGKREQNEIFMWASDSKSKEKIVMCMVEK